MIKEINLPLVSIIIPMYNQKFDYFKICVESAINQTYPNIEIIISDNHSTNNCMKVLEELSQDRLKIVRPHQHLTMIDNFIFAASHAQGEYISFLSSDDLLYPNCIAKVIHPLLESKDLSFSYCENEIIGAEGNQLYIVRNLQIPSGLYKKKIIALRMYNHTEYWIIGGIIRNCCFQKIGFSKDIMAGDWVLGFKLLKYGDVAYVNELLSSIRFHKREGEALKEYSNRYFEHYTKLIERHNYLINDGELLIKIGFQKKMAISYRDNEVLNVVIILIRNYHNHLVNKDYVDEIFELYKQSQKSFNYILLTRFYKTKFVLFYTYVLGFVHKFKKRH